MFKYTFVLSLLCSQTLFAQINNKTDKKLLKNIEQSVKFLASDALEGRRTGTNGEKLAAEYISKAFKKAGLKPVGDNNGYTQAFDVIEGKELKPETKLQFPNQNLVVNIDYFPMPYSATGTADWTNQSDKKNIQLLDLNELIQNNKDNPHYDLKEGLMNSLKNYEKTNPSVVFITNKGADNTWEDFKFDSKDKTPSFAFPVFYLTKTGFAKYPSSEANLSKISYNVQIGPKARKGHNVIGYIDNKAAHTIVIGAHYDHLGYGEDHNSLYAGSTLMIHNGADDNASGTAALIALSTWAKKSAPKNSNYLFAAFSGEELGLFGSKYLVEHFPLDIKSVNYMINMDMIGRLNDSTKGLTVGGYGTSPRWSEIIKTDDAYFKIKIDSAGSGPSDHTSFYRKDIPVLFFFTGTHSDYHKPSDDADKINYIGEVAIVNMIKGIVNNTASQDKVAFLKTREAAMGKSSFKVSLGIMPDYTFSGNGILVDGVTEGRAAQKAGIKVGDVLLQLGEHIFSDVQSYMGALNKFNKGEATTVKLKRGNEEIILPIVF